MNKSALEIMNEDDSFNVSTNNSIDSNQNSIRTSNNNSQDLSNVSQSNDSELLNSMDNESNYNVNIFSNNNKANEFNKNLNEEKEVTSPMQAALNFLQIQILNLPDNFELTTDNLDDALEYDNEVRNEQALDFIRNRATNDPYVAKLFDVVWNNGTLEDLEIIKETIESERMIDNINVDNEEEQRYIIGMYLHEGLNVNAPTYNIQVQNITNQVNSIIDSYKGKEMAIQALEFYKEQFNLIQEQKYNELLDKEQYEKELSYRQYQAEKQWQNNLINDLDLCKWSDSKKNDVINQFSQVKLDNGTQLPLWEYKMERIWENPTLTKYLMDFLSQFDEYDLVFKNTKTVKQQSQDILNNMVNQKIKQSTSSNHQNNQSNNQSSKSNRSSLLKEMLDS